MEIPQKNVNHQNIAKLYYQAVILHVTCLMKFIVSLT